jgi:acetyl-CoA C-acetyltransferase
MAAHVISTVINRHDVDPAAVDDVILGCLDNIARKQATSLAPPH